MFLHHQSIILYKILYSPSLVIVLNVLYYFTASFSLCTVVSILNMPEVSEVMCVLHAEYVTG